MSARATVLLPSPVNILLTNDDGIRAPGILAMHEAITLGTPQHPGALGGASTSVLTVAPLTVQSATSHGITFHAPVMTREELLPHERDLPGQRDNPTGIAVDGRPADCVKIAVSSLWPDRFGKGSKPDLVISGMNAGANCGINVIYSGTVAAAIEGAFLGIPSIAVSLRMGRGRPRFDLAAARARHVLERIIAARALKPYEILSINIPTTEDPPTTTIGAQPAGLAGVARHDPAAGDPTKMPPIHVCPMNVHGLIDKYERRVSPMGEVYYWAAGHGLDFHATELGSDVDLLMQGCITVTPLKFDLTQHATVEAWRERLSG